MRGAAPEDKGDEEQVTQIFTSILIRMSIGHEFDEHQIAWSGIPHKCGVAYLLYILCHPLIFWKSCTLKKDFKPIN